MGTQVTLLAHAHEGRSAAVCLARSRSAHDLPQNLAGRKSWLSAQLHPADVCPSLSQSFELCVWVYVGLGCEEKEADGNKVKLMGTKGFWCVVDGNKRNLMRTV